MLSLKGTILDHGLSEWEWLEKHYSPLCIAQEVLDSDNLESATLSAAKKYLTPLSLDTEEMFASFRYFGSKAPLLSVPDRSTIAIARHRLLVCASDDGLVIETCKAHGIFYTRTLGLLSEMVEIQYKTAIEVMKMADILIKKRGKYIHPKILARWKQNLPS